MAGAEMKTYSHPEVTTMRTTKNSVRSSKTSNSTSTRNNPDTTSKSTRTNPRTDNPQGAKVSPEPAIPGAKIHPGSQGPEGHLKQGTSVRDKEALKNRERNGAFDPGPPRRDRSSQTICSPRVQLSLRVLPGPSRILRENCLQEGHSSPPASGTTHSASRRCPVAGCR